MYSECLVTQREQNQDQKATGPRRKIHRLHCHQHTGILVPGQQRILPAPCLGIFDVCPPTNKVLVAHDLGQLSGDGTVDVLDDVEVGGEEDIKVALVDL